MVSLLASLAFAVLEGLSLSLLFPFLQALQGGGTPAVGFLSRFWVAPSDPGSLLRVVGLFVIGLAIVKAGFGVASESLSALLEGKLKSHLRLELVRQAYGRSYQKFLSTDSGKLMTAFSAHVESYFLSLQALAGMVSGSWLLGAYLCLLLSLSWKLTLLCAVVATLGSLFATRLSRKSFRHFGLATRKEEKINHLFLDDITGMPIARVFGIERERLAIHANWLKRLVRHQVAGATANLGLFPVMEAAYTVAIIATVLGLSAYDANWLPAHLSLLLSFFFVQHRLYQRVRELGQYWFLLKEHERPATTILDWLEGETAVIAPFRRSSHPSFAFRDVHFGYLPGVPVLRGVQFEGDRGELVALVGPSGSGKTTLAHLLIGLLTPEKGSIEIAAARIGWVPQENFLYDRTLYWNIALGRSVTPEQVRISVKQAGLEALVQALPQGLATRVGNRGAVLSAGERQRVALARAIVHEPSLLVLDEATSHLDADTEARIVNTIHELASRMAVIAISHKSALMERAHRVIELAGGVLRPREAEAS